MAPEHDLPAGTEQADSPATAEASRPAPRSGRHHRGRGRRRRPRAPRVETPTTEATPDAVVDSASDEGYSTAGAVSVPPAAQEGPAQEPEVHKEASSRKTQAAHHASIQGAIDQVNEIIGALKDTLEQMDEVLESLEYFERQGNADEREIESLRRSLRQLQRPRESSHHSHRGQ